jgi:hypothetical protein
MIGICGDNCNYCPRHVATRSGRPVDLKKVKELWVRLGLRDPSFPFREMACTGCTPENNCAYSELRACVYAKGIKNCGFCEAYPCELVDAAWKKSEEFYSKAAMLCTQEEMEMLQKAFFSKKQNLDIEHVNHKKSSSK